MYTVGKKTRRGALALIAAGVTSFVVGTGSFGSVKTGRNGDISVDTSKNARIGLSGLDSSAVFSEPHQITVTNNTQTDFSNVTLSTNQFQFRTSGTNTSSLSLGSLPVGNTKSITIVTNSLQQKTETDTITLVFASAPESVEAGRTITLNSAARDVISVSTVPGATATHTWTLSDYTTEQPIGGTRREIDSITVDYGTTGANFPNLTEQDITVTLTRELSSGPDRSTINVNQDTYTGSQATFDLSGTFDTNVTKDPNGRPNISLDIAGITNPGNTGTYQPTIGVELASTATDTFEADLAITTDPFFTVTATDVPNQVVRGDTFDVDYTIENIGVNQDTQTIELRVNGVVEDTEPNVTLGQNDQFAVTFSIDEGNLSQTDPYTVTVASRDESVSNTVDAVTANSFSLSANPTTPSTAAIHTWTTSNADFTGEVDTITVSYPSGSGFDFIGLTEAEITVTMERQLSSGPSTDEISVNSDSYSGRSATFDLSGIFNTDLIDFLEIEIDGIDNAAATGTYTADITLTGSNDTVTASASVTIN